MSCDCDGKTRRSVPTNLQSLGVSFKSVNTERSEVV